MFSLLKKVLLLSAAALVLSSCATMNKSECLTANWNTIGFGDGSKGYSASRIDQHRSACAEHGIAPDLTAYNAGRDKGLAQYCIPATGYNKGLSGSSYNGVCKGHNERAFLDAFNYGNAIYKEKAVLSKLKRDYSNADYNITSLEKESRHNERRIIKGKLSELQKYKLLQRNKAIAEEIGRTKSDLESISAAISDQQARIDSMVRARSY